MDVDLEWIWKEAAEVLSKYDPGISLEEQREAQSRPPVSQASFELYYL
jgi:hypothetical protein